MNIIFIGHSLSCMYAAGSYIVVQTPRCSDGSAGVHHQHRHVVRWLHICRSVGDSSEIVASLHLEAVRASISLSLSLYLFDISVDGVGSRTRE